MSDTFTYSKAWDEFRKRNNQQKRFIEHTFANPDKFAFPDAKTCVSYGAGCGEVDKILIPKLLPGLTTYYGNEPDKDNLLTLKNTMKDLTTGAGQIKFVFSDEGAEEFQGPEETIDVMFMFHMLQYLNNPVDFLQDCQKKLSPGGVIIITLRDGPRFDAAKYRNIMGDVVKAKPEEEIVKNIRNILESVGFSKVENYPFRTALDIQQVNRDVVSFLLMRNPSEGEMEAFRLLEKSLQDGGGKVEIPKDINAFICTK